MQTGIVITFFGAIFTVALVQSLLDRKSCMDDKEKELWKKSD